MLNKKSLSVGIIAPKNTTQEIAWLSSYIEARTELYKRGNVYDVVFFFNITEEILFIKKHTDAKIYAIAIDSDAIHTQNRNHHFIDLCDCYIGYKNFSSKAFCGEFRTFTFPAATESEIEQQFDTNVNAVKPHQYALFARNDPNIRQVIAQQISAYNSLLIGPLFNNPVQDKFAFLNQARYEFITENVVNDYYVSEKIYQSLLAGCVPIYYGCTLIQDHVPEHLFIRMRDVIELPDIINYCNDENNYQKHLDVIKREAKNFLLNNATFEKNIFNPLNRYLANLEQCAFRGQRRSLFWRIAKGKRVLKSLIQSK
jgi:hypothetical protein